MTRHKLALGLLLLAFIVGVVWAAHERIDNNGQVLSPATDTATSKAASITSSNVTIGGVVQSGQIVLAANGFRICAVLCNDSDTDIYIKLGASPALDTGILLNAYGGSFTITAANCYTGPITAVCNSATAKNLLVTEY